MFFWREPRNRGMRRSQLLTVIIFIIVLHDVVSAFQSPSDRNTSERRRKRKSRIRKSLLSCDDPLWMYYCQCQPDPTWSHSHPTASHMNLDQSPPPHTQTDTNTHTQRKSRRWRRVIVKTVWANWACASERDWLRGSTGSLRDSTDKWRMKKVVMLASFVPVLMPDQQREFSFSSELLSFLWKQ